MHCKVVNFISSFEMSTSYKRPVNIVVNKDPLPKTTTRKIKRKEVKELVNA